MNIDGGTALLIGVGLCGLCVVGIVLSIGLQIFGVVFDLIGSVFQLVFGAAGGSPCGCIVVIGALVVCGGVTWLVIAGLSACGTPAATNFCALIGR
ncbi:MAG: hypothetical protein SGI73_10215 [Chloroflexota bacterium]|nr:hypothetical protein [Chloroflexota bacterium]